MPELAITDALELIRELEEKELQNLKEQVEVMSAKLDTMVKDQRHSWTEYMKDYMVTGRKELMWKWVRAAD